MNSRTSESTVERDFFRQDIYAEHLRDVVSCSIDRILNFLQKENIALMDAHSLRNIINPLQGYIQMLWMFIWDGHGKLQNSMRVCEFIDAQLSAPDPKMDIGTCKSIIYQEIKELIHPMDLTDIERQEYSEIMQILGELFLVLWFRIKEFLQRKTLGDKFVPFSRKEIVADLSNVFKLMAKNSKGRYGIVFDLSEKTEHDYCMLIDILNQDNSTEMVSFPMVFNDTFRDLLANARKYSAVGSVVYGSIVEKSDGLIFRVVDHGMGIPESELDRIGEYWYRGSNVRDSIRGFWHGITKAIFCTQKFGGTIHVRSKEGVGTEVMIRIPKPTSSCIYQK